MEQEIPVIVKEETRRGEKELAREEERRGEERSGQSQPGEVDR